MSHGHCVHQMRCKAAETPVQSQHCTHYQSQESLLYMWTDLPQLEPLLKLVVEWLHRQKFEINEHNYHSDIKAVGTLGSFSDNPTPKIWAGRGGGEKYHH